VPIQLAQCWFPGLAISNDKYKYIFQIKRTLQFVCDVVKDTGKEEYLRQFIHIGLDWKQFFSNSTRKLIRGLKLPES